MSYTYKAVSLAVLGVTLGATALAQEANQEQSSSDRLEEIVVTGTRAAL